MKATVLVFTLLVLVFADDTDFLCTTSYCDDFLTTNSCPDLLPKCMIQNTTHNGIFLPFNGPCQCCDYCVANLDEGDHCAIGDSASPIPTSVCGDLLYCQTVDENSICQGIVTDCTNEQRDYDTRKKNGILGHLELRSDCDRRGLYAPHKCIPGEICYCVSEEGERIFGEIPYTILAPTIMNCECSRKYKKASDYLGKQLLSGEFLRCKSNGDFDALQCLDEDDCFCVHEDDGSLAINIVESVNVTSISNETLLCFDNITHVEGEYRRECEALVIEVLDEIREYSEMGYEIIGYRFNNCQLDGYYAPVQRNETNIYCADPYGNVLENFIIDANDTLAEDMDCKCARSRYITALDKPDCCRNGNYNPMQCRRGHCRCVDENGNQIAKEVNFVDRGTLNCFQTGCAEVIIPIETTTDETIEVRRIY